MANVVHPKAKKKFMDGEIDLLSDTIKIVLIDTGTVPYSTSLEFLSDVSAAVVGSAVTLSSKTTTDGVFDAANVSFTAVSGSSVEGAWIYKDTGSAATSPLLSWFDTASGLALTPNGGDITCNFNASGVFAF